MRPVRTRNPAALNFVAILIGALAVPKVGLALPSDYVFVQGFEPGTSIQFEGAASALFTEVGQSYPLRVLVRDEQGPIDASRVRWVLEGGSEYLVTQTTGPSASITSVALEIGSAELYAVDTGSGLSAVAVLAMADLAENAYYVDSELLVSGRTPASGEAELVLQRNSITENLAAGDVVVTDERAGLLIRITAITDVAADTVAMTVSQAQITDAFSALAVRTKSQPEFRAYRLDDAAKTAGKRLSDDLDCEVGGENAVGFSITGPSVDLDLNVGTEVELTIADSTVETFVVAGVASAELSASTGSLAYASNITGKVTCTFQLPEIFTPPVPVSAFSFQLNTAPTIGFEFEAGFSGPSFSIKGPQGAVSGEAKAGIQYTSNNGWEPLAETGWQGNFQPLSTEFDADISFELKGGPFVANEFGLVANLGSPPLGLQLADLRFVRLKGSGELEFALTSPLNPARKDYAGPRWDIDAILTGQYQAALADGLLFSLLQALDVPTQIDALTGDIFDPIVSRISEAPLPQVAVTCSDDCPANPTEGETVTFAMTAPPGTTGHATFLAARDGSQFGTDLGTSSMVAGQATLQWTPADEDSGSYELVPRLVSDALSTLFPYANPQSASFAVTTEERERTVHCYYAIAEAYNAGTGDEMRDGGTIDGGVGVGAAVGAVRASAEAVTTRLRVSANAPDSNDEQGAQGEALVQGSFIYDFSQATVTFPLSGDFSGVAGAEDFSSCFDLSVRLETDQGQEFVNGGVCRCEAGDFNCEDGLRADGVLESYTGGMFNVVVPAPPAGSPLRFESIISISSSEGGAGTFTLQIPPALQQSEPPTELLACEF